MEVTPETPSLWPMFALMTFFPVGGMYVRWRKGMPQAIRALFLIYMVLMVLWLPRTWIFHMAGLDWIRWIFYAVSAAVFMLVTMDFHEPEAIGNSAKEREEER